MMSEKREVLEDIYLLKNFDLSELSEREIEAFNKAVESYEIYHVEKLYHHGIISKAEYLMILNNDLDALFNYLNDEEVEVNDKDQKEVPSITLELPIMNDDGIGETIVRTYTSENIKCIDGQMPKEDGVAEYLYIISYNKPGSGIVTLPYLHYKSSKDISVPCSTNRSIEELVSKGIVL